MRPLALLLLLATLICGQDEVPPIEVTPVTPPSESDTPDLPTELSPEGTETTPQPPADQRDESGRIYIPSDPNPNREPAFDEIVPSPESLIDEDAPKEVPESLQTAPKDDGVRVSVLGYHEFSSSKPNTAMRIQTKQVSQANGSPPRPRQAHHLDGRLHEVEERRRRAPSPILSHHHR